MTEQKKPKLSIFRLDQVKYYWGQFAFNLGTTLFVTVLSVWMFVAFGNGAGGMIQVQVMVFVVVLLSAVIQCWVVITNTRQDYLRDKWYLKAESAEGAETGYVPNPWRMVLPLALVVGVPLSALSALMVPLLGREPFHLVNISFMIGIPLFALSSILIMIILPGDQQACASALARTRLPAVPPRRYLLWEYFLPWLPIQGSINFAVGLMQFGYLADKGSGEVPVQTVGLDAGFVFALIAFLSWISSQVQVRPDVRLGRVPEDNKKAPSVPLMLLLFTLCHGFGIAIAWVFLRVFFGPEISPLAAACFKAVVVMAAVFPGCALGVWWGRRRESRLIAMQ